MPKSINGTGSMFYGHNDVAPDGSYTTTEWITIFWIPLLPISSFRVLQKGDPKDHLLYSSEEFYYRHISLDLKHILKVYAVDFVIASIIVAIFVL